MNQLEALLHIPGGVYTSTPAYLPDPLFDFCDGLVLRLLPGQEL